MLDASALSRRLRTRAHTREGQRITQVEQSLGLRNRAIPWSQDRLRELRPERRPQPPRGYPSRQVVTPAPGPLCPRSSGPSRACARVRAGRECARADEPIVVQIPRGWEGSRSEAVCPGCQLAEWHPHCMSPVDSDGQLVDLAPIPREEWDRDLIFYCEYIDLSRDYLLGAKDWPIDFTDGARRRRVCSLRAA
jgi:hypothetical protein